ncbi:dihydroneopterin aldolase [Herbiconiux sp. L3-i23]|uniref:dihydroneopterin aldolase n=1 Tax=Herbiconiux sp. L3-i23 TaxID=2905871 RepID=UPI0020557099|nr:dihydroneopterin aldolase [Herbiconiux sp. L3-i23]BDI23970.1 hypothetical protein L3i23_27460 [Herbiconiux sp. L3-i23]
MGDRIELVGVRAFGRHGVYAHEREQGQEFVVDVVLHLSLASAAATDDVADTVHYGELAERIVALVGAEPVALIETLAQRIADDVLSDVRVNSVDVTVHKPSAPITVPFGDVSVRISRAGLHTAVIASGSNLGDRAATLESALRAIAATPALSVLAESPVVESAAHTLDGVDEDKPAYLNQVVIVRTELGAADLLARLQQIELEHGRARAERWGDRTLDLDIVSFDSVISDDPDLRLPHPRAHERAFVLVPWLLADPEAELPGVGRVDALAASMADQVTEVDAR